MNENSLCNTCENSHCIFQSGKPIAQLKDNKIIAIYNSAYSAAKTTGLSYNHIQKACHNKRGGAGGYKWRYATLEEIEWYNKVYYAKGGKDHDY